MDDTQRPCISTEIEKSEKDLFRLHSSLWVLKLCFNIVFSLQNTNSWFPGWKSSSTITCNSYTMRCKNYCYFLSSLTLQPSSHAAPKQLPLTRNFLMSCIIQYSNIYCQQRFLVCFNGLEAACRWNKLRFISLLFILWRSLGLVVRLEWRPPLAPLWKSCCWRRTHWPFCLSDEESNIRVGVWSLLGLCVCLSPGIVGPLW